MTEIWKPIKGYEDTYEVSNYGRVKSLSRLAAPNKATGVRQQLPERIMKLTLTQYGYMKVKLFDGSSQKCFQVHRLVALAFVDNPFNKPYIDHLDGNKINNYYKNLEWVTCAENNQRAYDLGLKRRYHGGQFRKGSNWERV